MNKGCSQALRKLVILAGTAFMPFVTLNATALANGAVTSALGGSSVGTVADGIPFNPASVAAVSEAMFQVGGGLPIGENKVAYLAFYEPKDPRGLGAAFSGMLGASVDRAVVGVDVATQEPVYYTSLAASYQVAEAVSSFGTFGAGVRYLQDTDGQTGAKGSAWRMDLGWQGHLASFLTIGVAARDIVGTDLRFSDESTVAREPSIRTGATVKLGSAGFITADYRVTEATVRVPTDTLPLWSAGASINVLPALTLRGGYSRSDDGKESSTVGVGIQAGNWHIDAAGMFSDSTTGMLGITMGF